MTDPTLEHEKWVEEHLAKIEAVEPLLAPIRKNGPYDTTIVETCPVCEKPIRLRVASYNKHARAQCETDDCVSFME